MQRARMCLRVDFKPTAYLSWEQDAASRGAGLVRKSFADSTLMQKRENACQMQKTHMATAVKRKGQKKTIAQVATRHTVGLGN